MKARKGTLWTGWLVLPTVVLLAGATIRADEEGRRALGPREWPIAAMRVLAAGEGGYWIGIIGAPIDPLLNTHLKIESGVVVQHVMPDSPANKAEIKENDILLKFGDAEIGDVEGLVEAVAENEDKKVNVTLLREGKKQTVAVTPAKRPDTLPIPPMPRPGDWQKFQDWMKKLQEGDVPHDPLNMLFVQPGVVLPKGWKEVYRDLLGPHKALHHLPKNTSVTVTKSDEGPAKIVVKKDGKTWEITEGELDTLPEDVRGIVDGVLGGGFSFTMPGRSGGAFRFDRGERPFRYRMRPARKPDVEEEAEADAGDASHDKRLETHRKKLEEMNRRLREKEKEIQREMEKMRQEIDKLKKTEV